MAGRLFRERSPAQAIEDGSATTVLGGIASAAIVRRTAGIIRRTIDLPLVENAAVTVNLVPAATLVVACHNIAAGTTAFDGCCFGV